jgi:hypothetical protein
MGGQRERMTKHVLSAVVAIMVLLVAPPLRADGRVQFLADRLKYPPAAGHADDFRVRTNAALALGLTQDEEAVGPLCAGLEDPNEAVRQGAAVGLRRLGLASGVDCLTARTSVETSPLVKAEIDRSLKALDAAKNPPAAGAGASANAKYYVALSHVTNRSSRSSAEVERVVSDAIASELNKSGTFAFAPSDESPAAAKAAVSAHHLKGYYLATSVEKFDYSVEGLRIRVKITVFSYPAKDLRGEVPAGAILPGARPGDKEGEDQLMAVVASRAAELFAQNFK